MNESDTVINQLVIDWAKKKILIIINSYPMVNVMND